MKEKYDTAVEWNFENDKYDKIFVNLGANDTYSAFVNEAKTKKFIESYKNFCEYA
ncbi:MAG: hypothetical protein L6V93_21085 [Clostridiales bacterium]|nr:MAG: hypothetical protein L6V93_21085 [Clostridiales bacterium]